jgi:Flp pilus assembly protein TadD
MLMRQRRTAEAETQFRQAIETDPNELDARYNLAQILAGRGEYDAAVKHFEHILTVNPKHVRACHAIGVLCAQQTRWNEAAAYFEKALAIDPNDPAARRDLDRVRGRMQEQPTP